MTAEPDWLVKARAEGRILSETPARPPVVPEAAPAGRRKRLRPKLAKLAAWTTGPATTIVVPLFVAPVSNGGAIKRSLIGRAGGDRRATGRALAACLPFLVPLAAAAQAGRPLRVELVRLGGGRMDDDNLTLTMKWVRDTVALFLGVDDSPAGPVAWKYGQQPDGKAAVRITLEVLG